MLVLALVILAATAAVPAAEAAAKASSCTGKRPAALKLTRVRGKAQARLTWRGPRRAGRGARYRVRRDGRNLGVRAGRARTVGVVLGRRHRFVVTPTARAAARCTAKLTRTLKAQAPSTPQSPAVAEVGDDAVTLSWLASRRGDGRMAGYRVTRNGAVVRQTKSLRMRVALPAGRSHSLRVSAVDTRGRRSAPSRAVTVTPGHTPPAAPTGLQASAVTDSSVTLGWAPSARADGYRVMRDGAPLMQTGASRTTVGNLAAATSYAFTVAAVDRQGYLSTPTAPVAVRTADPVPSTGSLHAFLLASTDRSFEDLQAHYRRIGVLYPTYFDCGIGAAIEGREDALITRWAQQRRILVMPRFNCQSQTRLRTILTDPGVRASVLAQLVALVDTNGYDGLNLDFESGAATERDALTSFVGELAAALHARGRKLTVEASAKTYAGQLGRPAFYDYPALGAAADWVFVMNWGKHWSTSTPGAMDDLPWATTVADYVATMPQRERYVLGFPLYGMDWAAGGGPSNPGVPLEYAGLRALIADTGATPALDPVANSWTFSYTDAQGVRHDVFYGDATTFDARIRLARDRGLQLGVWRLGEEDPRLWDHPLLG